MLKQMREFGLNQLFACGDGCWNVKGFIQPAAGAATQGQGVLVLSAAPAVGRVPGSAEFAERYTKAYGPIANYAANSADVAAAMRGLRFQGIAYARPVEWDTKGDNRAAVIFLNVVEGERFKEIGEITRDDVSK